MYADVQMAGVLNPSLNQDSSRLLRLAMLEARMSGSHNTGSEHVLLSILRDANNGARVFLMA